MTLSKAERSKRDLKQDQAEAVRAGEHFSVRYSLDGEAYAPPSFFGTLEEAQAGADTTFARLNTARGADVHARPGDIRKSQVWVERFSQRVWIVVDKSVRHGHLDTAKY